MAKKILVIEDDPDTLELMEMVFSSIGCDVVKAANKKETIDILLKDNPIDLIISDLSVPGLLKNEEIVDVVRSHLSAKDTPIVLVSGNANIKSLAEQYKVNYLSKPVDLDDLFNLAQ